MSRNSTSNSSESERTTSMSDSDGSDFDGILDSELDVNQWLSDNFDAGDVCDSAKQGDGDVPTSHRVRAWKKVEQNEGPSQLNFTVDNPGPSHLPPRNSAPITYFHLLFTPDTMSTVVKNTIEYGGKILAKVDEWKRDHPHSRLRRLKLVDITVTRLKQFIGLSINMGLFRKANAKKYWSKEFPSQYVPFFASVMSYPQFALFSSVLQVGKVDVPTNGQPDFDKWSKVRPVLDALNASFRYHFVPPREVSIHQRTIGMRKPTTCPGKKHYSRCGVRKLCDAASGYVIHVKLYAGKDLPRNQGQAHDVVMDLMRHSHLLNKGYHLFADNACTSPQLAATLHDEGTLLTGAVRSNLKSLPHNLPTRLNVGEAHSFRQGTMLVVAYQETGLTKKPRLVLSTCHGAGMENNKPKSVAAYDKYMGEADVVGRMIHHVPVERPSKKCWQKVFFTLIEMVLLNAYVLYGSNTDGKKMVSHPDFIASIVEDLCEHDETTPQRRQVFAFPPDHELVHLPPGKRERDCAVCSDRALGRKGRKRSSYYCSGCDLGVHSGCFDKLDHKKMRIL